MADVWLAPYLPLSETTQVGPWLLVPFRDFARRHTTSQPVFNEVRRLRTAYRLTNTGGVPFGGVVVPAGGRIGDEAPRELLRPLHHALIAALIDANPSLLEGESQNPNAGHSMVTAENALVYGHPLHGGNSYVISTGAMVQTLAYVHAEPGRRLPPVAPPAELATPLFASLDDEYATELYETLGVGDLTARRLSRTIEWLALAWNNSAAISEDARVVVLRTGFEALLGGGASTRHNRALLSRLLDEPGAARAPRTWPKQREPVELTDLEWWFQSYALLRNKLVHGDIPDAADWVFDDGERHLHHADHVLRRAIKRTVVNARNNPRLELPRAQRILARAYEESLASDDQ